MTLSDSILLQIGQNKTTYNDLLTRILPNYSSKASAKAALSRAVKNLVAFGSITKSNDYYLLTAKGKKIVESKLKNKILININELIKKSKNKPLQYVDEIIKNLQIFLERSKQDPTLLKVGKTSATFYISDIILLKKYLEQKIEHYNYINNVLNKQVLILQEQNFEDQVVLNLDSNAFKNIKNLINFYSVDELVIDCNKDDLETIKIFEVNYMFTRKSDTQFILPIEKIDEFKKLLFDNLESIIYSKFKIYINEVIITLDNGKLYFVGPHNLIVDIK